MTKELNPAYNPKDVEEKIYRLWEESGYFDPDKLPGKHRKKFSVMMAPPNITGSLHMGHALENVSVDILVRAKRMQGFKTLWLPGIDHAGIAAQNVVEKELRKQNIRRQDLGREKFVEKIWEWKEKYGGLIFDQFKKLGVSPDWSRTRFTLDPGYVKAVQAAFINYYEKGWIYRGERVINWCPKCETGISDLEIEYREENGKIYHIKYPLTDKSGFITVATTRPETMLGDAAVAVHPSDERYKKLIGKKLILPIQEREIPIIADHSIDPTFGTGAVKITPAHDVTDFEISLRHDLPKFRIIDGKGVMTSEAGAFCEGLKTDECRQKIVDKLSELGLLEKVGDYTHNVAYCERSGTIVEPRLSKQWFLKMSELAKLAQEAIEKKETVFYPEKWAGILTEWLQNIKDWNISRQLWWGHQLPVWFHEPKCIPRKGHEGDIVKCKEYAVSITEPKCEFCDAKFVQSEDVLDTWFSSALWPFATLGWPGKTEDLATYYPTDFITSAREILNLWIARMIFSGKEFMEAVPFKTVYIHATILTREGKRMSKSLGTGIDPLFLIEKYGADATRFGLIYQNLGTQDIRFSEEHVVAGKKFCNKIWNAARFVMTRVKSADFPETTKKNLSEADKQIHASFEKVSEEITDDIEVLEFGRALHKLYDFFWHEWADKYIETSKKQAGLETEETLFYVFTNILKLLHPFIPFVTEEIWQTLKSHYGFKTDLLIIESWLNHDHGI
ncbi:valine--tRNA ligase [Candidatus Azambacteria bacterium RIFCSPHIGHO2_01_FULL_44_55]|uniref:Valine--tRNA ligase n=1 Tax=Candidatus Azambacteria bacterium RIFCSPLOWO2_02_FULL_44_14 TaxID=1797306 RepID=A0A1F5CCM1_9BACT|nr:MAG: valine--tRNA ligase [Candidatus Azambacteria bacterium RIFCSPLOWO2_01_FULL_44_84]OGD32950.1 MAG: valine--tRNA ligase [Candidatus Azambacteria bacterium RIFCSPHIGHO2_02_FULL_45_18]OGD40394.1 MAG: valine--tRNA ligase [Candidatus Azambacteria bacterium RIFCSPHIGHO2_01_FULL_44_55]OGD40606.1 MAG: valine--tRNA ligase [Candidatus Azambacteria bacterium RIFCSPLOWO2_02_FULL_44_14]